MPARPVMTWFVRPHSFLGMACSLLIATGASAAGSAPLADAARQGNADTIRGLLSDGADVNAPHGDGMTALHWAARRGDNVIAQLLLAADADPNLTTRLGDHTPLHVASRNAQNDIVETLLAADANPHAVTTAGATPLHFASAAGSSATIVALLDNGADPNAREPRWGQTPLMFAAAADRVDAVMALLARGADPSMTATVVNITERNALDRTDSRRHRERMSSVRTGRPIDPRSNPASPRRNTRIPRPSASSRAEARAAEQAALEADLLEEPEPLGFADLVSSHGGLTALLLAAREGHTATAHALIEGGADIDQKSAADGSSPLLIATINGQFDLAMTLLERGADPTLASDAGATPLYGALNMHWAPKARHPQPTDYMQQRSNYLDVMQAALERGADVNARLTRSLWYTTYNRDLLGVDRTGATPFWRAAYALDLDAMRLLLHYGADAHLPTVRVPSRFSPVDPAPSGLPPVPYGGDAVPPLLAAAGVGYGQGYAGNSHRHVPDGWLAAARFLGEEMGADPHARDHNGYNAIHHAAARGDNELIRYLVSHGVDVTQLSRRGQTTIDMANGPVQRIQPFPSTITLLESLGAHNNHRCLSC